MQCYTCHNLIYLKNIVEDSFISVLMRKKDFNYQPINIIPSTGQWSYHKDIEDIKVDTDLLKELPLCYDIILIPQLREQGFNIKSFYLNDMTYKKNMKQIVIYYLII